MTKKQLVRGMINDWIAEMPAVGDGQYHVDSLVTNLSGADLHKTLDGMTYAELSTVLCLIVAQNAKACEDQRKWFRENREATRQPCPVVHLKVVK